MTGSSFSGTLSGPGGFPVRDLARANGCTAAFLQRSGASALLPGQGRDSRPDKARIPRPVRGAEPPRFFLAEAPRSLSAPSASVTSARNCRRRDRRSFLRHFGHPSCLPRGTPRALPLGRGDVRPHARTGLAPSNPQSLRTAAPARLLSPGEQQSLHDPREPAGPLRLLRPDEALSGIDGRSRRRSSRRPHRPGHGSRRNREGFASGASAPDHLRGRGPRPARRTLVEQWASVRVAEVYQATEGFLGSSCRAGRIHLNEETLHIERLWIDDARERFHPVITDLSRTTQWFVRHRLNDVLMLDPTPCPCGRRTTTLRAIEGRAEEVLWLPGKDGALAPVFPDLVRQAIYSLDRPPIVIASSSTECAGRCGCREGTRKRSRRRPPHHRGTERTGAPGIVFLPGSINLPRRSRSASAASPNRNENQDPRHRRVGICRQFLLPAPCLARRSRDPRTGTTQERTAGLPPRRPDRTPPPRLDARRRHPCRGPFLAVGNLGRIPPAERPGDPARPRLLREPRSGKTGLRLLELGLLRDGDQFDIREDTPIGPEYVNHYTRGPNTRRSSSSAGMTGLGVLSGPGPSSARATPCFSPASSVPRRRGA